MSTAPEETQQQLQVAAETKAAAESTQQIAPLSAEEAVFRFEQRKAVALASSTIVPDTFKGNPGNCLIALELAGRVNCSPLAVMQNLAIVHGKPSFSGQFLIGLVNACGRFDRLKWEIQGGEDPKAKTYRVRAYATHLATGEVCRSTWIDWPMVDGEGWSKKAGSKWLTMPGQMFMYRSAAFFARVFAPELALGFPLREEVEDVYGAGRGDSPKIGVLKSLLEHKPDEPKTEPASVVFESFTKAEVLDQIERARNRDQLDEARDLIRHVPDTEARRELIIAGDQKQAALEESAATVAGGAGLFPSKE